MGIASEIQAVVDNIKETRENVLKSKKKLKEYVRGLISNEKERSHASKEEIGIRQKQVKDLIKEVKTYISDLQNEFSELRGDFKEAHNIWQSLIKDKKNVKSKKRKAKK